MASLPPEDLLPVLVADLADEDARDVLEAAAFTGGRIYLPLETAPVSAAEHVLEVQVPGVAEPLTFLATPLGPPTADGFPLRIKSTQKPSSTRTRALTPPPREVMRSKRPSLRRETLSASHTADLGPPRPDDSFSGRALAGGKLLIESLIGRGGVGAVYRARHRELKMPIAVKVLHESFQHDIDFCRRFYAEALAASRLDHPNVTRVIDFGQEPSGQLYFAMEFLDGSELRALLDKERVLPTARIVDIMVQVCAGLSHAHARGIIHRDIKPENLVIVPGHDDDGNAIEIVKVCDFGIAQHRALPASKEQSVIAGTPEYMSPEQCRGDELDARSDLYACGVVLYEMATGQVPFTSERPQSILNKHQFTPLLAPSTIAPRVDPALERVIQKALAKEPEERYQNMRELRAALRELTSAEASPAPSSVRRIPTPQEFAPVAPAAAPAARAPEWLERGPVYAAPTAPVATTAAAAPAGSELADAIAANAAAWMRELAQMPDPRAFAHVLQRLDPALRTLAARGDVQTLWAAASTLQAIAMDGTRASGSRADLASRSLRIFQDPNVLALVAEQLLTGADDVREKARRILVNAGVAGAYGLYGARVKLAGDPAARGPFGTVLAEFGPRAWPVVRAALEKILASEPNAATMELAEDLLLCVPLVGDEQSGHIVVKYLRVNVSGVCRAATAAIVKLWGERAKPLLVGMLQSKDDVVRVAGIAGLRQIEAIDEHVVPRLSAILTRRLPAGDDLRAAAAVALGHATSTARPAALSVLTQLVTPARDVPLDRAQASRGTLSREDAVVIALARSLLAVGGVGYRGLVAERADRSPEPLRGQLRRLLSG
jgi:serine/threonine-protein kinase